MILILSIRNILQASSAGISKPSTAATSAKETNQEISLRPNAGVAPSGKIPTSEATGKATWGNKANPGQASGKIAVKCELLN